MKDGAEITGFLEDARAGDLAKYEVIQKARGLVRLAERDIEERIIYGGIMFRLGAEDIGGVFPSKQHVSFTFGNGYLLDDPEGQLEGKGKYRRHLKLKTVDDIDKMGLAGFITQALGIAGGA
ncbi:MAG: DUF1801 domain-containing protein [Rhodobacteraceae bacterium]|nr:DUF1801 domain-containing protein [Paracoccaceae bacterium]